MAWSRRTLISEHSTALWSSPSTLLAAVSRRCCAGAEGAEGTEGTAVTPSAPSSRPVLRPQAFVGIDPGQPVAHRQTVEPHDSAGPVDFQSYVRWKALRTCSRPTSSSWNSNAGADGLLTHQHLTAGSGRSSAGALVLESTMRLRIPLHPPSLSAAHDFSTGAPPGRPFCRRSRSTGPLAVDWSCPVVRRRC